MSHRLLGGMKVCGVALATMLVSAACRRAPKVECEQMCARYSELAFWAERSGNAEVNDNDLARLRASDAAGVADLAAKQSAGLAFCVQKCQAAGNTGDNKCVIAAPTFAAAQRCTTEKR